VASGGVVWLLDGSQPVAVAIDAVAGTVTAIVAWPFDIADAAPWWQGRCVAADGTGGIIVQTHFGAPLTWLGVDGLRATSPADGLGLFTARDGVAWCGYGSYVDVPDEENPVAASPAVGTLAAISPDGRRREITIDRPVRNLCATDQGIVVVVAGDVMVTPRAGGGASYAYPESAVLVAHDFAGSSLRVADLPNVDRPPVPDDFAWWRELDEDWIAEHAIPVRGLRWVWGSPGDGDKINRRGVVLGYAADGAERVRCELGVGHVRDVTGLGDEVVLIFSSRRCARAMTSSPRPCTRCARNSAMSCTPGRRARPAVRSRPR
jgi:hypothetical protein